MIRKNWIKISIVFLALVSHAFCSAAQEAEQQEGDIFNLEQITVTAQKQEEKVQEVPISISIFDENTLEDKGISSVRDLGNYTPNMIIFDAGSTLSTQPGIRGMFTNTLDNESVMGVYVDGVPITTGIGIDETLIGIERIEVLKGPQGTLYGKNTEVGVINIISKQPDNESRSKVGVTMGSNDLREYTFSVSGPVVEERFFIGISGKHYEKDGFVENTETDEMADFREHDYLKLNLRYVVTDDLEISLIKSYLKYNDGAGNWSSSSLDYHTVQSDLQGRNESENELTSLKIIYQITDQISLESITSQRIFKNIGQEDYDYTTSELYKLHYFTDDSYEKYSEEIRLNGVTGDLKWLVGLYADQSENNLDDTYIYGAGYYGYEMEYNTEQVLRGDSMGIFAHLDYSVTNRFSVIAGIRYDDETRSMEEEASDIDLENEFTEVSPKFALKYKFSPEVQSYFTVAKGYRAGGFNPYAGDGYPKTFDEETLWSYELGMKSSFWANRLTVNISIYQMDISDMQVTEAFQVTTSGSTTIQSYSNNAAEATSKGLEFDVNSRLTDFTSLFAGVGYNDCRYDSFEDDSGDYSGNYCSLAPEYSYNLGLMYRGENGIFTQLDTTGYGKMYMDKENETDLPAYQLVNFKIGYESSNYDIYLYGKNIFDEDYDTLDYSGYDTYSQPSELGVTFNYRI